MRLKALLAALFLLFSLTLSTPSLSQDRASPPRIQVPPLPEEDRVRIEKDMAKRANQERQAQLKRDTEHLLKLATELKEYVDKSNENTLSLEVIRKADEIERFAHSVKEKMKGY